MPFSRPAIKTAACRIRSFLLSLSGHAPMVSAHMQVWGANLVSGVFLKKRSIQKILGSEWSGVNLGTLGA